MTGTKFLVRFDDICPTMNWDIWSRIESLLAQFSVRPILAVVPDNQDPNLRVFARREDFWDRVRSWQSRGWAIGLHGWQHVYQSDRTGIVGINKRSEFAGLPFEQQRHKIFAALDVFARERVRVDCWIAPGHSFDWETLEILRSRNVTVVSDGYFWRPVVWRGMTWVPQQLWRFRPMPAGLWTVCFHHNHFAADDVDRLGHNLERFRRSITDLKTVIERPAAGCTPIDRMFAATWRVALKAKRATQ